MDGQRLGLWRRWGNHQEEEACGRRRVQRRHGQDIPGRRDPAPTPTPEIRRGLCWGHSVWPEPGACHGAGRGEGDQECGVKGQLLRWTLELGKG